MRYQKHIFVCTNRRPDDNPRGSCACKGSEEIQKRFKELVHERGLKSQVRVNSAGCLDACEFGPSVVVYPEGVWYGGLNLDDVDEIVEQHIAGDQVVDHLLIQHRKFNGDRIVEESLTDNPESD